MALLFVHDWPLQFLFTVGGLGSSWKFLLLHVTSAINYPSCRIFLAARSRSYSFSRQIVKRPFSQCSTILNSALWSPLGHFYGDNNDVDGEGDEWCGNRDKTPGPSAQLYLAFFNAVCMQNSNNRSIPNLQHLFKSNECFRYSQLSLSSLLSHKFFGGWFNGLLQV